MLCEVRVEGGIGEMEHAGAVVGHGVDRPWEVLGAVAVAVEALVVAGQLAQVRGWSRGGDGAFARAADGRSVVTHVLESGVSHRVAVSHDVKLRDDCGLFQVAVGDVAFGVVERHERGLDIRRERQSPVLAVPAVVKVDATHTRA